MVKYKGDGSLDVLPVADAAWMDFAAAVGPNEQINALSMLLNEAKVIQTSGQGPWKGLTAGSSTSNDWSVAYAEMSQTVAADLQRYIEPPIQLWIHTPTQHIISSGVRTAPNAGFVTVTITYTYQNQSWTLSAYVLLRIQMEQTP